MIRQCAPLVLAVLVLWGMHPSTRFGSTFWLLLAAGASMLLIVLPTLRPGPGNQS